MAAVPAIRLAYAPDAKRGFLELLDDVAWEKMALEGDDVLEGGQLISE